MKLRVYQDGGGLIYTPFIPGGQETLGAAKQSKSSDDSEDAKLDPLDKELLGLMKDQSLIPSDIQMIFNKLIQFQKKSQQLSSVPGFGGTNSYRSVMPGMLQIMSLVSQAKYNKSAEDEILKKMMSENAGNEFAIDGYGRMYVQDEDGKIKKVRPSEFDAEKYMPLSNSQLLHLRERDPNLAFDGNVFEDMRNMVGMTSVAKEIDRIIKEFGSEEGQRYLSKDAAQIFLDLNSPEGLYKLTLKQPSQGLKEAWKTIWDQLPSNMQNLLKVRAAASGDVDPKRFIQDIVMHNIDVKQSIDYDSTASKAAGIDVDPAGTKKEQQVQDTYLYRVASLNGPRKQVALAPKGAKVSDTGLMVTMGITNGAVVKALSDGRTEKLGSMSLPEMLMNAEAVKAADSSTIVLGNKVLEDSELGAVMFNANTECNTVLLPYTYDRGRVVPDFETFEKFNQLQAQISGKFDIPRTEVDRLARELGLSSNEYDYDANTNSVTLKNTMYFLSFGAIVNSRSIDLSKDNKRYLEELDDSEAEHYKKAYDNMLKYGKIDRKKSDMRVGDYSSSGTHWGNHFYKGLIWMAMPDAYRGAHLSMNEYINKADVNNFGRRTEMREQQVGLSSIGNEIGSFKYE